MSELFLDTELDESDIASIARRLRGTGIAPGELERIYEEEVAPACWRNLTALPGGEWAGFERTALIEAVQRQLDSSKPMHGWPLVRRWRIKRWTALTREDWQRVRRLLA